MLVSVGLVVFFALTLFSTKTVLIPDMDQSQVSVSISMPIGSEVDETAAIADRVSAVISDQCPEMTDMYYTAQDESATVTVNLVGKSERRRSSAGRCQRPAHRPGEHRRL